MQLAAGSFVEVRGRPWLVEEVNQGQESVSTVRLSCISDDAQGDVLEVVLNAEVGVNPREIDPWLSIGQAAPDDPEVLAAYLRTVRWRSVTAADRDLLQAPFRAGIRLDPYQLLPLRKALRLPRVNLLIADDVGLGKTIEAGLVARELLLRRRVDFILIAAPPPMTLQWKDELETKFGLTFEIIDREFLTATRRLRGFGASPWATGSRFIVSHRLLTDEVYVGGLRDMLGDFRPRALLVLDEAHHAAPSGGARYAISSQLSKAVREIGERFEHRLFLTATPHNGHSNSFSALLEMLDPQRFTRGVPVRPKDLEPVMVRRLKADLRHLGEAFPERVVEAIVIDGLPADAPELDLARRLAAYGELRERRIRALPAQKAALAELAFVGLQQRLLSSIAAFARTLKVHRQTLERLLRDAGAPSASAAVAHAFVDGVPDASAPELGLEGEAAEQAADQDEDVAAEAATTIGAAGAATLDLEAELAAVDAMLVIAERHASKADARVRKLVEWIEANLLSGGTWNSRRLIIFTEYEDTRRWLERRLREALATTDRIDERLGVFTGATGSDRREEVKRAFNADPRCEPVRILICTDAAREGINLQSWCADLFHLDLPWNPARIEQRNGRIDRKLQPAKRVTCRYFVYAQREADIVLDALVRKTETIRTQLGAAGQVIEERVAKRIAEGGIRRGEAAALARAITAESDAERLARARAEMDDEEQRRHQRLLKEQDELMRLRERSRERVGVEPADLERVVAAALARIEVPLDAADAGAVGGTHTFRLDPEHPGFAKHPGWADAFDDLRARPRKRGEKPAAWRKEAPVRAISFRPAILEDGRDADGVVQVHLEHRLVRRLLSRFLSQGFQSDLSRVAAIQGPGAQPRVVLLGRLVVFGAQAARLHEEVLPVTAIWTEVDRGRRPLKALGEVGAEKTLNQLEDALRAGRAAPAIAAARIRPLVQQDVADLRPTLEAAARERLERVTKDLARRGDEEARSLTDLLQRQRARIADAAKDANVDQLELNLVDAERREREADRRHWAQRLAGLERELAEEPLRLRQGYAVQAHRVEPVGIVYLWPGA